MKKTLLSLALAALAMGAQAQERWILPNALLDKMSPGGVWYTQNFQQTLVLYNIETGFVQQYEELDQTYVSGKGNALTDDGYIVGMIPDGAALWHDGEWHLLPVGEEHIYGGEANGITPDHKYICGSVGCDEFGGDGLMMQPCLWTLGEDGNYTFELLPYPTRDFTNQEPEYVTAICVSDDGTTVAGQVLSYYGVHTYPILYHKSAEGEWTYTLPYHDKVYDDTVVFPYPNPKPKDYMDKDEKAAWRKADSDWYAAYIEWVENDCEGDMPTEPIETDYLSTEHYAAYQADLKAWREDPINEIDPQEALHNATKGRGTYEFNNIFLSANGKYLAGNLDSKIDAPDWVGDHTTHPTLMSVEDGVVTGLTEIHLPSMTTCSVTNNGDMTTASPAMAYARAAYFVPSGSDKPMKLLDKLTSRYAPLGEWFGTYLNFDVLVPDGTDYVPVNDSIVLGTVVATPDGNHFSGYVYDEWDCKDVGYVSWTLNFDKADGIVLPRRENYAVLRRDYDLDGRPVSGKGKAPRGAIIIRDGKKVLE